MRERLNVRLTATVLVTALAAAVIIALVHRWQVKRSAPGLLELALTAESKGRADRAQWLLAAYLELNPHDTAARLKYAEITEAFARDPKNQQAAAAAYEQVLAADPDRVEIRRRLARLYASGKQFSEAQEHLKKLPGEAGDVQLLAECQEGQGDLKAAEASYRRAIELDPLRVAAHVRLAVLLQRMGNDYAVRNTSVPARRRDEADRVMLNAVTVTADPGGEPVRQAQARLARAQYLLAVESDPSTASDWVFRLRALSNPEPDLEAALHLDPASDDVRLTAASVAAARGRTSEARDHLQAILERVAAEKGTCDDRVYLQLANLEARLGKSAEALDVLLKAASRSPQNPQLLLAQVDLALGSGRVKEAKAAVAALTRWKYAPEVLIALNARVLMAEDKWEAALNLLRDNGLLFTTAAPGLIAEVHLLRGRCHEQLAEYELARDQFDQALAIEPGQPGALAGTARCFMAQGQFREAVRRYADLVTARAPASTWLMYLRLRAVSYLSAKAKLRDKDAIDLEKEQLTKVRDEVTKALPDSVDLVVLQSEIDDALDDTKAARGRLEEKAKGLRAAAQKYETGSSEQLKKVRADEQTIALALARFLGRHGNAAEARRVIDDLENRLSGPTVESVLVRLALTDKEKDPSFGQTLDAAKALFARSGTERLGGPDHARLATGLAEAYALQKQLPEAREWWRQVARLQPRNLAVRFRLFDLAVRLKDRPGMEEEVREIRAAEGGPSPGPFAHAAQALLTYRSYELAAEAQDQAGVAAARERFGEALGHLDAVARVKPTWAIVFLLRAEIYRTQNNNNRAIADYIRAVELGEQPADVIRKIVEFCNENGRADLAGDLIRKIPVESDPRFQKLAAELSLRNSRPDEAVTLAANYIRSESNKSTEERYKDHLWHAAILNAAGRNKEDVLEAYNKAKQLAGTHAAPWVELIGWHMRAGRRNEAEKEFQEAGDRLKGVDLARCHELFGEMDKAGEAYRAALTARPNDVNVLQRVIGFYERTGALGKVVPLLEMSLQARPPLAPDDAASVRRLVPVALASRGDYGSFKEALRLADAALAASGDGPENTFVKAQVLATRPERRKEALKLLEGLREQQKKLQRPFAPAAQRLLARMLIDTGDWNAGRALLVQLSREGSERDTTASLRLLVDRLVRRDEPDAEGQLDLLAKVAKDDPETRRLQAVLFVKQKKFGRAKDFLNTAARPLRDATAETNLNRLRFAARLADELGREAGAGPTLVPVAEAFYRDAAKSGAAGDELALAGFLARCGQIKEAIERFRAAEPKAGAIAATAALVTAAYGYAQPALKDEQLEALTTEAETLLKSAAPSAGTKSLAALIYARRGRYAEAAKAFKEVADADPQNAEARGQQAYMLVLENRTAEAEGLLKEAADLGGPSAGLLDTRGMMYLKTNQTEKAIEVLQQAIEQQPSAVKYVHLADAYRAANRPKDAKPALERAKELQADGSLSLPAEQKLFAELAQRLNAGK